MRSGCWRLQPFNDVSRNISRSITDFKPENTRQTPRQVGTEMDRQDAMASKRQAGRYNLGRYIPWLKECNLHMYTLRKIRTFWYGIGCSAFVIGMSLQFGYRGAIIAIGVVLMYDTSH